MAKGTLVVIGGPTASGKTRVAAALARSLGTEVIIGTARPNEAELLDVPHHFLGHLDLEETWSAGVFARAAEPVLQHLFDKHGIAVLVGGSGLYIDALIKGLDPLPAGRPEIRERIQERYKQEGLHAILQDLLQLDPVTYGRIDRNNPHRVIRALEVCQATGRPYSEQRTTPQDRDDMRIIRIALDLERDQLYSRINERVDRMMAEGLLEEARALLPHRELNALRTVGYTELFQHFDGTLTLAEAVEAIKQHTRNYAKRQMTWMRRELSWTYLPPEPERVIAHVHANG
jgi:tRNA dimethylallyltransferase